MKNGFLHRSVLAWCGTAPARSPSELSQRIRAVRPLVGAIRWDAWSGGEVTRHVERTLGPKKYHFRLPWFTRVVSQNAVTIHGARPQIMDQEIEYAAEAGLDYWAFVLYPETSDMSRQLNLYLASPLRKRIRFCIILHGDILCSEEQWPAVLLRYIRLMRQPTYQNVLGERPLVYLFRTEAAAPLLRTRIEALRKAARAAALQEPYLVFMGWNPVTDWRRAQPLGFDAVSAYAFGGQEGGSYADLVRVVETQQWALAAREAIPLIPLVHTGWDKRPRMDNPVPWEKDAAYLQHRKYHQNPRPEQIAAHLQRGLQWVRANKTACPPQALIVYAWNENDEGGWLIPTRNPDGSVNNQRLRAVQRVLSDKGAE